MPTPNKVKTKTMEIYLRTKKVDSYFCGKLIKYCNEWEIRPIHGAGGRVSFLKLTDWRTKTKKEMLDKIKKYKSKHNLTSKK